MTVFTLNQERKSRQQTVNSIRKYPHISFLAGCDKTKNKTVNNCNAFKEKFKIFLPVNEIYNLPIGNVCANGRNS